MRYSQHPAVHYLPVSDDEVVVKGSHLEGFSLLVTDDTNRGLARRVIDLLADPASADEVRSSLAGEIAIEEAEIEALLEELAESGAILRHGERSQRVPEWISFLRFGHADASAQAHPLVVAGGSVAVDVVATLNELGFVAEHVDHVDPTELEGFVVPDVSMNVADRMEEASPGAITEADLPDDDLPRLAIVVEGAPLRYLYDLNQAAVDAGAPILYAQVAGSDYAIGPQVVPGATACFWEFERQRARSLFSYSEYAVLAATATEVTTPRITANAAAAALIPHLVELALLGRSMLAGRVLRGHATTAETSMHSVMRLPRCPTCLVTRPMLRNPLH
ncbi:MAG: TOMM precursor leader peptide-binding protein [Solirubrobacterales bacterium]